MIDDDPNCPKCGYGQPWIVEVRGVYDGGLYWECPSCHHQWPRFSEGKLHRVALEMIAERAKPDAAEDSSSAWQ